MDLLFETKHLEDQDEMYELLAGYGDDVIGRLTYRKRTRFRVYSVEVSPEYRRQGVGSALMHRLAAEAIAEKANMIEYFLPVEGPDEDNLSYFVWKCGFEPVDRIDPTSAATSKSPEADAGEAAVIHYELRLDNPAEEISEEEGENRGSNNYDISGDEIIEMMSIDDIDDNDLQGIMESDGEEDSEMNYISRFGGAPELQPVTNADLICRDCIYRTEGDRVFTCHKYLEKPYEVITDDVCTYHLSPFASN